MIKKERVFGSLFTDDEFLRILENNEKTKLTHPLIRLLEDKEERIEVSDYTDFVRNNTKFAISCLTQYKMRWLKKIKKRLLDENIANVSGALGEIRCFGYLIQVFGEKRVVNIDESKKPTPDFRIDLEKNLIYIETATIQMNEEERKSLQQSLEQGERKNGIYEHISHPFGIKNLANIIQSTILKLISVKEKNNQFSCAGNSPTILWIDLQDERIVGISDRLEKSGPFFSGKGYSMAEGVFSNELWYSVYSRINDPVFSGETLNSEEGNKIVLKRNLHNGKFYEKRFNNLSAVIYCSPNSVILYENPFAKNRLPDLFVEILSSGPGFKMESSRMQFPGGKLKKRIKKERNLMKKLAKKGFFSW